MLKNRAALLLVPLENGEWKGTGLRRRETETEAETEAEHMVPDGSTPAASLREFKFGSATDASSQPPVPPGRDRSRCTACRPAVDPVVMCHVATIGMW